MKYVLVKIKDDSVESFVAKAGSRVVGVWDLPPTWWQQLALGGRIVVPLRMRGVSRSVAFVRDGDHLVSVVHQMAGFVSVQGEGAHQERLIPLHNEDVELRFDEDQPPADPEPLKAALLNPRVEAWSGVQFGGAEPFDTMFFWLVTVLPQACMISRARTERAKTLADPASPIATPVLLGDGSFAYVTFRHLDGDTYEFGSYGHGPDGEPLARQLTEHIRAWDRDRRHGAPAIIRAYLGDAPAISGGRAICKRHTTVTISWP